MVATTNGQLSTGCAMRKIQLMGQLGQRFGEIHHLAVHSPAEAVRALSVLHPGFAEALQQPDVHYRVLAGNVNVQEQDRLHMHYAMRHDFIFTPVIAGGKSHGLIQVLAGTALFFMSYGLAGSGATLGVFFGGQSSVGAWYRGAEMVGGIGLSLAIGGVIQMLAPVPTLPQPNAGETHSSSAQFNGPVNTTQQGLPVPLLYGRLIVGSAVISSSLSSADVPV
jgi:predicted phage tail protein